MTKEVADHLTFKDLIWVKPKAISTSQCASCIEWFWNNEDLHQQGQVYGGDDSITNASLHTNLDRKNTIQAYPSPDDPISDFMTDVMTDGWKQYSKTLPTPQGQPMSFSDYSVRIYYKNQGKFLLDFINQNDLLLLLNEAIQNKQKVSEINTPPLGKTNKTCMKSLHHPQAKQTKSE